MKLLTKRNISIILMLVISGGSAYYLLANSPGPDVSEIQRRGPVYWMRSGTQGCGGALQGPVKSCRSKRSEYHFQQNGWQSHLVTIANEQSLYGSYLRQSDKGFNNYPINDYPSIKQFHTTFDVTTNNYTDSCLLQHVNDNELVYQCEVYSPDIKRVRRIHYQKSSGTLTMSENSQTKMKLRLDKYGKLLEEHHYHQISTTGGTGLPRVQALSHYYNYKDKQLTSIERHARIDYLASWFDRQQQYLTDWWNDVPKVSHHEIIPVEILRQDKFGNVTKRRVGPAAEDIIEVQYQYWPNIGHSAE